MDDFPGAVLRAPRRARELVLAHQAVSLAVAGFVAGWLTVIAGGRLGTVKSVIPITSWLGLLSRDARTTVLPGSIMLLGIVALVGLWMVAIRIHHSGRTTERQVWSIAGTWAVPFIVGPPLLSNDVFTYSAQGLLLRDGFDPYKVGPSALGDGSHVLAAVDPSWRSVPSPYGPLATTVQHLAIAISGGSPIGAVVVFRALGVLCLAVIGLLAADLAGPRRVQALTMTVLNPLLLLQVVSAAHLDGIMCALLLGALVAANQRNWLVAIVLAAAAGSIKAPGYLAVVAIIVLHQTYGHRVNWRALGRDASAGVVAVVGISLAVPDGWGWIHALNTPALGHTALAPASLIADLFNPLIPAASFDDLTAGGRISALILAGCIVLFLTVTVGHRALDRTVGYGMLAVGLLSPVVYPWYLLGGVACLAPTARAARRDWLVLISAVGCLLSPPGFSSATTTYLSVAAVVVSLLVIAPRVRQRYRDRRSPPAIAVPVVLAASGTGELEPIPPVLTAPTAASAG